MKRKMAMASMVLAGTLMLGGQALAQETQEEQFCDVYGKLAEHTVTGRDQGITLQYQIRAWRENVPRKLNAWPVEQRQQMSEALVEIARMVYAYPEITGYMVRWFVTTGCLNPGMLNELNSRYPTGSSKRSNDRY